MKKIFGWILGAMLLTACNPTMENNQVAEEQLENYGPHEVNIAEAITAKEMVDKFKSQDEPMDFTFKGELTGVCAKAGCWVSVADGNGGDFMIRFKDHFTIPTDTELKQMAYVHGTAYWMEETVEELKEQAEIDGKSKEEIDAIVKPNYYFSFQADGVKIKKVDEE